MRKLWAELERCRICASVCAIMLRHIAALHRLDYCNSLLYGVHRTLYCASCSLCRTTLHDWSPARDAAIISRRYYANSIGYPFESASFPDGLETQFTPHDTTQTGPSCLVWRAVWFGRYSSIHPLPLRPFERVHLLAAAAGPTYRGFLVSLDAVHNV